MPLYENECGSYSNSSLKNYPGITLVENVSTQTDHLQCQIPMNFDEVILNEECKKRYLLALNYINRFHDMLNEEYKRNCDEKIEANNFTFPQIPNYLVVHALFSNLIKTESAVSQANFKNEDSKPTTEKIESHSFELIEEDIFSKNFMDHKVKFQNTLKDIVEKRYLRRTFSHLITNTYENHCDIHVETRNTDYFDQKPLIPPFPLNENNVVFSEEKFRQQNPIQSSFNGNIKSYIDVHDNKVRKKNEYLLDYETAESPNKQLTFVRPHTPKKVKSMFDCMSRKNFKLFDFHDDSDSDGVISDLDQQFEQRNKHYVYVSPSKEQFSSPIDQPKKSIPLQLNQRDLMNLDEKAFNAIGLFTNNGEIRPEIVEFIERKKLVQTNDSRNKLFRCKRQWDLKNYINASTNQNIPTETTMSHVTNFCNGN